MERKNLKILVENYQNKKKYIQIGFARGCIYVLAQNFGAIAGAGLLRGLVSTELRGGAGLGATGVDPNLSIVQVSFITQYRIPIDILEVEMLITMVLVLLVYSFTPGCRSKDDDHHGSGSTSLLTVFQTVGVEMMITMVLVLLQWQAIISI